MILDILTMDEKQEAGLQAIREDRCVTACSYKLTFLKKKKE